MEEKTKSTGEREKERRGEGGSPQSRALQVLSCYPTFILIGVCRVPTYPVDPDFYFLGFELLNEIDVICVDRSSGSSLAIGLC